MFNRFLAVVALVAVSSQASAALVINLSNASGKTQFDFSGSDTFTNSAEFNNGIWFNDLNESGAVTGTRREGRREILSGSGVYNLGASSFSIENAYVNDVADFELGLRGGSHIFVTSPGMDISISGSFVADIDYTWFVEGSYFFGALGPFAANEAMLTEGLRFNIGAQNAVPEPSLFGLTAFALLGLGLSRRTRRPISERQNC